VDERPTQLRSGARESTDLTPESAGGHHRVVVIGAGFAGLGLALRLRVEGLSDVVLLERENEVGGTWYLNTYPGCQCDVPSLLYSLSSAPKADWTRTFAPQREIEDYLRSLAEVSGVRDLIRFGTEVTGAAWDATGHRWALETTAGALTADIVVLATGTLNDPVIPPIPGVERFAGTLFHSARWRHDHDLAGERVAVVGTGASAVQFVPKIQGTVGRLTVFQRTPPWVLPRPDRAFRPWESWLFARLPSAARLARARIYWSRELMVLMLARYPRLASYAAEPGRKHLEDQVSDLELRSKLTPDYLLGCKRILLSNDYFPALGQANVELVTEPISEIRSDGVTTSDGMTYPCDTIIFGTGFSPVDQPVTHLIRGVDGRSMADHWVGGNRAYLGSTVPGFPNLFLITGPNTGLGHSSMIYMMESQFNYIVDALKTISSRDITSFEVGEETAAAFNAEMQTKMKRTVWSSGCSSWYLDASGHNTTLWPDFTWQYRRRTRHFDSDHYTLGRRSVPRSPPVSLLSRE
jgi:cation diffusion facilitator CzcD-associated flavoprotein CzcO